ncbi:MAG TPA: hypothetical protein VFJ16_15495 [Longimicrobium sp.]|nr:hypothetical protein [Longimicrobium sp.]
MKAETGLMWMKLAVPVALPLLGGCLLMPLGDDARPRMRLEAVERSAAPGAPATWSKPVMEPGERGYLFTDSVIAVRTRVNATTVRFRLWNTGRGPITVVRDAAFDPRPVACPSAGGGLELRSRGPRGIETVAAHGSSHGDEVVPVAPSPASGADPWRPVGLLCFVFDPVQDRIALRVMVAADGTHYRYTFWYRLIEPPRED